jgi:hypothetical protein
MGTAKPIRVLLAQLPPNSFVGNSYAITPAKSFIGNSYETPACKSFVGNSYAIFLFSLRANPLEAALTKTPGGWASPLDCPLSTPMLDSDLSKPTGGQDPGFRF